MRFNKFKTVVNFKLMSKLSIVATLIFTCLVSHANEDFVIVKGNNRYYTQPEYSVTEKDLSRLLDRFTLHGQVGARLRYQENRNGETTHERMQYRYALLARVGLTANSCGSFNAYVTSSDRFDTLWDESGLGDSQGEFQVFFRRFYFDSDCLNKKIRLQLGAVPPSSPGTLGLDEAGWVDGLKLALTLDESKNLKAYFTLGELDEFDEIHFFKREFRSINFAQLTVTGEIGKHVEFLAEATTHDNNEYLRAGLEIIAKEFLRVIDKVGFEELLVNGDQQALIVSMQKEIGPWSARVAFSDVLDPKQETDSLILPIDNFIGLNKNIHFYLNRDFGKDQRWSWKSRVRLGEDGVRAETRGEFAF